MMQELIGKTIKKITKQTLDMTPPKGDRSKDIFEIECSDGTLLTLVCENECDSDAYATAYITEGKKEIEDVSNYSSGEWFGEKEVWE